MQLYISREKSGALHLAELGLEAGRQASRRNLKFFKLALDQLFDFQLSFAKVQHSLSKYNAFLKLFSGKHYSKAVL